MPAGISEFSWALECLDAEIFQIRSWLRIAQLDHARQRSIDAKHRQIIKELPSGLIEKCPQAQYYHF